MAFFALPIIFGLEGMHFGHLWPPWSPGGCQGGYGGTGGVPLTKTCNFFGSHIWIPNWEVWDCMNWKHFIFQVFGHLRRPKMVVLGWNGLTQKYIFLKNRNSAPLAVVMSGHMTSVRQFWVRGHKLAHNCRKWPQRVQSDFRNHHHRNCAPLAFVLSGHMTSLRKSWVRGQKWTQISRKWPKLA